MLGARTQPDVHLIARIEIHVGEGHQNRFVVETAADAFDQGREVQNHDIELNAELGQILLDQGEGAFVQLVSGIGDHREFHLVDIAVEQGIAGTMKAIALEPRQGRVHRVSRRLQGGIQPETVRDGHWSRGWPGMTAINHAANIFAIDGVGDGAPEFIRAEPAAFVFR